MAIVKVTIKKWIDSFKSKPNWKVILFVLAGLTTVWTVASGASSAADGADANLSSPFFMMGVAVKLGGILLLIIGGSVLLRKYQGKLPGSKSLRQVVVLESVRISPRQALHLVKAGNQQLLIGATDQGIALISVVEPVAQPALEPAVSATDDFQTFLHKLTARSTSLGALEPQQS